VTPEQPTPESEHEEAIATFWRRLDFPVPSYESLLLHAEKFGPEGVEEIARLYLGPRRLARLQIELDELTATRKNGRYTVGRRRQRSEEETALAIELLSVEGLTTEEIASKIGVSSEHVQRVQKAPTPTARVSRSKRSDRQNGQSPSPPLPRRRNPCKSGGRKGGFETPRSRSHSRETEKSPS
jgi:hypothetical protein